MFKIFIIGFIVFLFFVVPMIVACVLAAEDPYDQEENDAPDRDIDEFLKH